MSTLLVRPGLLLIKTLIQKELGYKIPGYTLLVNHLAKTVFFDIADKEGKNIRHPYADKKGLMQKVANMVGRSIPKGATLDMTVVKYYDKQDVTVDAYFTDLQNEKQKLTTII